MIAVYARVSTEESALKGYSISSQIEQAIKKAGTSDVVKYIDEGVSGEFLERPGLQKLREDVQNDIINKIIVYDPDRLSRNLMNALIVDEEFRKKGIEVQYVNGEYADTAEGKLFFTLRGAVAEFEKAKIRERMMNGRKAKGKQGKLIRYDGIYGYNNDKENGNYAINEEEAKIVRLIFDYYTRPDSPVKGMNGIAKQLTSMGIPTKTGKKVWSRNTIRQILYNQTYTGKKIQNRWNTEGHLANKYKKEKIPLTERPEEEWIVVNVPQIISEEQYNLAQELLDVARRRHSKESFQKYLLSGLLRCGVCGNTITGVHRNDWGTKVRFYTDKKSSAGEKNTGCGIYIRSDNLEGAVWEYVLDYIYNPEKVTSFKEDDKQQMSFEKREYERLQKEIEKTRSGRKRLLTLVSMSDEDMDLEEIKEEMRNLQKKELELKEKKDRIEEKLNVAETSGPNQQALEAVLSSYFSDKKRKEFTFDEKQSILRMLVKEIIVYDKENIEIRLL